MTTFGSTDKSDQLTDSERTSREERAKTLNLTGLSAELQIQKQMFDKLTQEMTHTQNLVTTLMGRLQAIEDARVRELQLRVGNGPTA